MIGEPLPTNGPEIARRLITLGLVPTPLSAPIEGDSATGKNPAVGGGDWWNRATLKQDPSEFEGFNVGVCAGKPLPDGGYLLVLDPDVKPDIGVDGIANLAALAAQHGGLPETFTVRTGSGGLHIYLRSTVVLRAPKICDYVDTRASGGQVVAPGCYHYSGNQYKVEVDVAIAQAPAWLETLISSGGIGKAPRSGDKYEGPAVTLTREVMRAAALSLGPLHGSYTRFMALANGQCVPGTGPGNRHDSIDCRLMTEIVGEFGPGVTDDSVVDLLRPSYQDRISPKNLSSLIDGLYSARGKWSAPAAEVVEIVEDPPIELTQQHCIQAKTQIGRRSAGGATDAKIIWAKMADGGRSGAIMPSELAGALKLIRSTFPTCTQESVAALLRPPVCSIEVTDQAWTKADPVTMVRVRPDVLDRERLYQHARIALNEDGRPLPTTANVVTLVYAALGPELRLNTRGRVVECRCLPWCDSSSWRMWTDDDDVAAMVWIGREHGIDLGSPALLRSAVIAAAGTRETDPFGEWLESLTWDGQGRLDTWLVRAAGCKDDLYRRAVGARFLLSVVARTYQPGCKVDTKLVLVGKQGARKSTLLETIVGSPFYGNVIKDPREPYKDFISRMHRCVLHEDQEMATYSAADVAADKAMLSTARDEFRPPFGRAPSAFPRAFVLAGTTNETEGFLRDVTGGRRYWPVEVGAIDLDWLRLEREQIWAEAVSRYCSGEQWWLTPDEDAEAALVVEDERDVDVVESRIRKLDVVECTLSEMLSRLDPDRSGLPSRTDQLRVSRAMKALGYTRKRASVGNREWLYRRGRS